MIGKTYQFKVVLLGEGCVGTLNPILKFRLFFQTKNEYLYIYIKL